MGGAFPEQTIALGHARQSVADLEAQIADLTEQLELSSLVAPVDGVVSEVNIDAGLVAPASDAIVVASAAVEVTADVVETDVASLALGQTATVSIDALGLDVSGTVTSIAASTEGGTSSVVTFPVTVTLTDPDGAVRPGMSADVEIVIAQAADVVTVPAVALDGRDGEYGVLVADAIGAAELRQVSVGLVTDTLAEIQSGLSVGETVVVGTNAEQTSSGEASTLAGPGAFGGAGLGGLLTAATITSLSPGV